MVGGFNRRARILDRTHKKVGVADLRYERLNLQIIETSINKASEFSTYFFHTLIKQRQKVEVRSLASLLQKF
ncbi:hypothetical protein QUA40_12595 [Microcoleus sp. Pol11C3]|uniref:hypothetical protein n=1 Tax=Microcoleus sp. Pol11C3 TaxID=3055390 RepID=UPI002FD2227C